MCDASIVGTRERHGAYEQFEPRCRLSWDVSYGQLGNLFWGETEEQLKRNWERTEMRGYVENVKVCGPRVSYPTC
jgi:hypothetical protein